eukprot:s1162_g8.t1
MGGAIKHLAADKASSFHYIQTYLVDIEVLRNEASTAVSEMQQDKDGIRFDLNTPAGDVVNNPNFFNMNVVANNVEVPYPYQTVVTTRTEMWYTVNQDYYNRMPINTSPTGDHSDLLTEIQLHRLCGIMYDFARQVGYGLRTYNKEIGSSSNPGNAINIHQSAVMLKSMPEGMDHPLAYAVNSFQAFTVCLHVIHSYTSWREYGTEVPYYQWTNRIVPETDMNSLTYLEFHLEAVCKPQRQNGLQLPPSIKQHAWNQLAVESGFVHECVRKKGAVQSWEDEFATMDAPHPLFDGDGQFPPKLQGHPNWVYDTGRVAAPWASNLPSWDDAGTRRGYYGHAKSNTGARTEESKN